MPSSDLEELARLAGAEVKRSGAERAALQRASPRCLRTSRPLTSNAWLHSTATARICRHPFLGAFEALARHDVIVGPTHDGGYYLVGAKASHAGLFDGDSMGTKSALEALLARARALQLSVDFTEHFYDIDVASDLARLAAELRLAPAGRHERRSG